MSVRTSIDLTLQIGRNNSLASGSLAVDAAFAQVLDTLDRVESGTYDLDAGETNVSVDFGDITEARLVYIEADREITVTPGAPSPATTATVTGSGGTYVTGFVGGETLILEIDDGGSVTVTFDAADQSLQQVINRINAALALNGQGPIADNNGGELRLTSLTTGVASEVDITGGTALVTLGLSVTTVNGVNALAGQTPLQLYRPANLNNASLSAGVKVVALLTLRTTSLLIDNPDPDNPVTVFVALAGDVILEPPADCTC